MNKPNWKDVDERGNYLSQDYTGTWYWHEFKPTCRYGEWFSSGMTSLVVSEGDYIEAEKTLEKRP